MKARLAKLAEHVQKRFSDSVQAASIEFGELTVNVASVDIHKVCLSLRDEAVFGFDTLIDVCVIDYLHYGVAEWATEDATEIGFSRATDKTRDPKRSTWTKSRFGVIYHLLSVEHNIRLRLRVFLEEDALEVDSVTDIWSSANWFEREAFDLFGVVFKDHPDLRRILTDYGFVGHPFRKDFPLIGEVEMRYDATQQKCVYAPVSIQPRTTVAKVIRSDHRYKTDAEVEAKEENHG